MGTQHEAQAAHRTLPVAHKHVQIAVTTSSAAHLFSSVLDGTTIDMSKPILMQAGGCDVYVLGANAAITVASPGTETTGGTYAGLQIAAGEVQEFWFAACDRLYVKGSAAGFLNLYQSSEV